MESQQETCITVKEAARRIGYSVRQTDRFIKAGELEAIHVSRSLRTVTIASIDAFLAKHRRRPSDPLASIKNHLHTQEQITGDILRQLALLRQQAEVRDTTLQQRVSDLEGRLRILTEKLQQERDARQMIEQIIVAHSALAEGEGDQRLSEVAQRLLMLTPRLVPRGPSPQEKRGLPPGTIRLAHFAIQHGIEPGTLRQHAEKQPGLATVYERPHATQKKYEWWLLSGQQYPLLHSWQTQKKSWHPCPDCPHEREANGREMSGEGQER
jgi:hypothetical protein